MKGNAMQQRYASRSVPRALARAVVGFGLLVGSVALIPVVGLISVALVPAGLVALRGCPTCAVIGLVQTISRGRIERTCDDGGCRIAQRQPNASPQPTK
jgi:hypothetical protein